MLGGNMQPTSEAPASASAVPASGTAATGAAPSQTILDLQTRFLYPFVFDRRQFEEISRALRGRTFVGRRGDSHCLWDYAEPHSRSSAPHHLYQDELLEHVASFLFPSPDRPDLGTKGCGYLKIADVASNKWFKATEVRLDGSGGKTVPVDIVDGVRVEMFLSPQGVGALSVALTLTKPDLSLDEALDFNYRIAQFRRHPVGRFQKRHPEDDPVSYARLSPDQRASIPSRPTETAPLEERLGAPGGSFELAELIGELLRPFREYGMPPLRPKHQELLVYTVVRLGPAVSFADPTVRDRLAPFLAALAQVEEPGHSGTALGNLSLANAILNNRHWAAVGLLGAAHLIADQLPTTVSGQAHEVAFNEQKLPIVRDKYFIPYLLALLQRLVLNRAIDEAGTIVASRGADAAERIAQLRDKLLDFSIGGNYTQVSVRQALHRYYQIARTGLDVPDAWDEVRRTIADLDARATAERQGRLASNVARNVNAIKSVQEFVHLIESFLVSVYFAHLWHMFAAENEPLKAFARRTLRLTWAGRTLHLEEDWFVSLGVILFALLGFGVVKILNRYQRRREHKAPPADEA
jgi:hypothetical protein